MSIIVDTEMIYDYERFYCITSTFFIFNTLGTLNLKRYVERRKLAVPRLNFKNKIAINYFGTYVKLPEKEEISSVVIEIISFRQKKTLLLYMIG